MRRAFVLGGMCIGLALAGPSLADFESPSAGPEIGIGDFNPKLWELTVRAFLGHNDNVLLTPDLPPFFVGDDDAPFGGISANLAARLPVSELFSLGAAVRFDQTYFFDKQPSGIPAFVDDHDAYDMTAVSPSVYGQFDFDLGGMPTTVRGTYSYRYETAEVKAVGLDANSLNFLASIMPARDVQLSLSYTRSWNDFSVKFAAPSSDRDGKSDQLKFSAKKSFDAGRRSLEGFLSFTENNAKGSDWDYDGWGVGLVATSHIFDRVHGQLSLSYSDLDYKGGFVGVGGVPAPGRKDTDVYNAGVKLFWAWRPDIVFDGFIDYTELDANLPQFSSDNTVFGVGVSWRY